MSESTDATDGTDAPAAPEATAPARRGRDLFVRVAVNVGRPTYQPFTYRVPAGRAVEPGEVVHVPWGARTLQGIVIEPPAEFPGYAGEVRPLEPPVAGAPRVPAARLTLGRWIADTYRAPLWESFALLLPPGAGERPVTEVVRAPGAPPPGDPTLAALPERQRDLLERLDATPHRVEVLRQGEAARAFDATLAALVRRGFAERRYSLDRPRGRARIEEIVVLAVPPEAARTFAEEATGRRASRRARALRALRDAGGPLPFAEVARAARGAPAVETLLDEEVLRRLGDADDRVEIAVPPEEVERWLRVLGRSEALTAGIAVLEHLAGAGAPPGDPRAGVPPDGVPPDGVPRDEVPGGRVPRAGVPPDGVPLDGVATRFGRAARAGVRDLVDRGLLRVEERLGRRDPLAGLDVVLARPPLGLFEEQREAAETIEAAIDRSDGSRVLLVGVTGSGKTEVYLAALGHAVAQGRRGLVLVPEIALTPQTVRRFAERFPGRVGVLHSGLSLGEAFDEWHRIAAGAYDVVIGSRSAIFAPQPDLGLIVLDEAHEWTYKQHDAAPRYDTRTVAQRLAELSGAALVYGTATPDAERWHEAADGDLARVDLPRRVRPVRQPDGRVRLWPAEDLPPVEVVDVAGQPRLFSDPLVAALAETLDRDEQAILFLNRRGLAGHLICAGGHSPTCRSCDISLALHEPPGGGRPRLLCHLCGREQPRPDRCRECQRSLRPARAGTQRVEREVRDLFPTARVLRWDRDTARTRDDHEALLGAFQRHDADVLVGTQMIAKGLDLPLVTLVGVVLADYGLWSADFRARERTFQLLEQVAGRAGRADRPGRVIVQTMHPDHAAIRYAQAHDVDGFFEEELGWRAEHEWPPFRRLARLLFQHRQGDFAVAEAHRVAQELRRVTAGEAHTEVLGPTPPAVGRIRGRYRWQLLVRADDPGAVLGRIELPTGWIVDIDPMQLG